MKFKTWLKEIKNMSYSEYKELDEYERYSIEGDFRGYNAMLQKREAYKEKEQKMIEAGVIEIVHLTGEEREEYDRKMEIEKRHYDLSLKVGGIDELGNYTALHHRHN